MKNTLKILGVSLLVITGVVKLINNSLEEDLKEKFESYPNVQKSSIVSITNESTTNEKLDFYSNKYVSFYYPKNWTLTQNKQPFGYSINLQSNDNCEEFGLLSLVILDNPLSEEEALKFGLKGFLKSFDNYQIHNSTKAAFKGNVSVYKKIDITESSIKFFGEAFAFIKNNKTFTLIKLCDSETGLNENFSEFENSFEVLSSKNSDQNSIKEDISKKEKLAKEGDKVSQAFLGYAYLTGNGAPINYEKAFYWNKKLAESGYAGAMYLLGHQYKEGLGTQKDLDKGNYWTNEAKKNGFKE
jgi:hypothetical protein